MKNSHSLAQRWLVRSLGLAAASTLALISACGGGGSISIDDFRGVRFDGIPGKTIKTGREDKGAFGLLHNFIRAVRGEEPLAVTAAHGLRATRIALEAVASARGIDEADSMEPTDRSAFQEGRS